MIASFAGPLFRADKSCGSSDGAAGVDQQDGESGAGGVARVDRFVGALVWLGAFARVIADIDQLEHVPVQNLRGFARRFGVLDER